MNEQMQNPIPAPVPAQPVKPDVKTLVKELFLKIYKNKKIFWLIVSLFSLIILIIIAGVIFKLTRGKAPMAVPTASPIPLTQIQPADGEKDPLDLAREELLEIDKKIKEFDINQKRLSPPSVNFNISF